MQKQIDDLKREIDLLKSSATIPYEVEQAFRVRLDNILTLPNGFTSAPLAAITSPTGGAVNDVQARTAIDTIITRLEDLGLLTAN